MPPIDFDRIVNGSVAFLQAFNGGADADFRGPGIAAAVLALAQARDVQDSTTTAATYTAYNPEWRVDEDELFDAVEDLAPMIRVIVLDWPHDEFDGSGDNLVQRWRLETMIGIAALGTDRKDAIRRFRDVCAVLANHWTGSGARMGLDRDTTGIERSGLVGGRWATAPLGDQFICSGFMMLRVRCRWTRTNEP